MQALRTLSSRATITPTSFTNVYEWGDFRGSPETLMADFFDAFLYLANWGTRCLSFRFRQETVDLRTLKKYCLGEDAKVRKKGQSIIVDLTSEDEGGNFDDDGEGRLSSLIPLRGDIAAGDLRPLYLCWLMSVSAGEVEDDAEEPPCPTGLRELPAAHEAFVEFMRIDRDLVAVAAANSSPRETEAGRAAIMAWVASLPAAEKDAFVTQILHEDNAAVPRASLLRRLRFETSPSRATPSRPRKVGELRAAAATLGGP
jgi:hypothetical protein